MAARKGNEPTTVERPSTVKRPQVRSAGRPSAKSTRQQPATRERILSEALKRFSEVGFEAASTVEIARRAGVAQPLVHYYFKRKIDLWKAAVDFGFADVQRNLATVDTDLKDLDALSRLKIFVRRFVAFTAARPDVGMIIQMEGQNNTSRLRWLSKKHLRFSYGLIDGLINAAQREGTLKSTAPPYHIAQIIVGASYLFLSGSERLHQIYGIDSRSPEMLARHADLVIEALFSGLCTSQRSQPELMENPDIHNN